MLCSAAMCNLESMLPLFSTQYLPPCMEQVWAEPGRSAGGVDLMLQGTWARELPVGAPKVSRSDTSQQGLTPSRYCGIVTVGMQVPDTTQLTACTPHLIAGLLQHLDAVSKGQPQPLPQVLQGLTRVLLADDLQVMACGQHSVTSSMQLRDARSMFESCLACEQSEWV